MASDETSHILYLWRSNRRCRSKVVVVVECCGTSTLVEQIDVPRGTFDFCLQPCRFAKELKKSDFFHFYYTIHCFPLTTMFLYSVFVMGNMHFGQLYCIKIIPMSSTHSFPLPFLQKMLFIVCRKVFYIFCIKTFFIECLHEKVFPLDWKVLVVLKELFRNFNTLQ